MKRILVCLLMTLSVITSSAQVIGAYITDNNGDFTNVRNAPKGKVVGKISTKLVVMVALENYNDGWWKLSGLPENAEEATEIPLPASDSGYWVHYSVVGFSTRNYGGQTLQLHASPDTDSPVTFSFSEEMQLHPVGVVDGWVKVKTDDGKHTGWIQDEWICDNPLTNCC